MPFVITGNDLERDALDVWTTQNCLSECFNAHISSLRYIEITYTEGGDDWVFLFKSLKSPKSRTYEMSQ